MWHYFSLFVHVYIYIYIYTHTVAHVCIHVYMYEQLPDGEYTLYLYQTEPLGEVVDDSLIASMFRIENDATLPQRQDGISDFFYGDVPPVVALHWIHIQQIAFGCNLFLLIAACILKSLC
jgi:hypothetical protein